jgi:hypothetical protein
MTDNLKICNNTIKKIYQFFKPNSKYIITSYGYYKQNNPNNSNRMIKEHIIIDERVYTIHRHLLTFVQTDDTIRALIHNMVYKLVEKYSKKYLINHGILIGGEMYLYGKILNEFFIFKTFISDTESIVHDSKLNDPNKSTTKSSTFEYVNYSTYKFTFIQEITNSIAICNVSKNGLGTNLSEQLGKSKPKIILSIWCSYKALEKDYEILKKSYNIIQIFRYKTNYEVFLGVLECK